MNKLKVALLSLIIMLVSCSSIYAQQKYSLEDIIQMAKAQSPFSKQAETRKENRYWQYRYFRSNYNPQLRLSGNLPNYNRDYFQNRQDDGTFDVQKQQLSNANVNLGLEQPISITGGTLSVNSNMNRYQDYIYDITKWNGNTVNVMLQQPIFGYNYLRWDRKIEPLLYEESRREYVQNLESISQQSVTLFFTVLDAQINLQLAEYNLANNDTIYKIEQGRYNIGTTTRDKLLQAELQLLRSKQDVTTARIGLSNSKLGLRSYVGLKDLAQYELELPQAIPELKLVVEDALTHARNNRAEYLAFQRRRAEAEREVAQARGERFDINLTASYGLSTSAQALNNAYEGPFSKQQYINLQFDFPIMDWGRNRSRMRRAIANQKLNDYIIAQDEVDFEQEIITKVAQFEVLLSQIEISKKSDEVAQERYEVSQNRYLIGKVDITNLNNALTEKDDARRSYLNALRSFWTAYYELRTLTLYDFSSNKLLYNPNEK